MNIVATLRQKDGTITEGGMELVAQWNALEQKPFLWVDVLSPCSGQISWTLR